MKTEKVFSLERRKPFSTNITPKGGIIKKVVFGDQDSGEVSVSVAQGDITQNRSKIKNEFLPFLNERDGMGRLLNVNSIQHQDTRKFEPSNPSLYYKSERFNKFLLRLEYAEENRHALGNLLQYSPSHSNQANFLELARAARLQKLNTRNLINTPKNNYYLRAGASVESNFIGDSSDKKNNILFESLELDFLRRDLYAEMSPNSPQNLPEIKKNKTKNLKAKYTVRVKGKDNQNPEASAKKTLYAPSDKFSTYYKKLQQDLKELPIYSNEISKMAQNDIVQLDGVAKKFEKTNKRGQTRDESLLLPPQPENDRISA